MDTDNAVMEERQKRQLAVFWQVICVDPVKTSHVFSVSFTVFFCNSATNQSTLFASCLRWPVCGQCTRIAIRVFFFHAIYKKTCVLVD